ncbi:MAG: aldehyde ferredoxin oxidoreductase family protein [Desulfobacterota bacterium]|nr:aldehyde ferredoxin oxidoreductase family protein [Thermodesulfobacteriota bacterium]
MKGWVGKMLRVNLTQGDWRVEELDRQLALKFIGGRGLGSKILYDEIDPRIDPLSPQNKLILATGPLTGTSASAAGRYMAITKSPLTGAIACSNSGGHFGAELKFAGFDLIIVEGKAKEPVYLFVEDGKVEIREAKHLWGKTTHETTDQIRAETDMDAKVACIGPAGEKLVRFACIINDKHRAAGRSGVGAVMGSKNLKAIAVKGSGSVCIADKEGFRRATLDGFQKVKANPVTSTGLPAYGTAVLVNVINQHGLFPTRNFQEGVFEGAEKISGETLAEQMLIRNQACFACPIACGRVTRSNHPKFAYSGEGPEYESDWALGACCGVDNLDAIGKANYYCDILGLDPISAGVTIACAMELFERGILTSKEVGRSLYFGDAEAMVEMVRQTGYREGFGDALAEGSYRLAERFGHPEFSMSVKKQEFPAYDGRGAQGMGLQYATSNRGACHVRGYMISPEILGAPQKLDPFETEEKAGWTKAFQDTTAVVDSSGICLFNTFAIGIPEIAAYLKAATGVEMTQEELMKAGERVWNLERLFNLKAGMTGREDRLPERIVKEPLPSGPAKGQVVRLEKMLPEYYEIRGWDKDGVPTPEKLKELGLE